MVDSRVVYIALLPDYSVSWLQMTKTNLYLSSVSISLTYLSYFEDQSSQLWASTNFASLKLLLSSFLIIVIIVGMGMLMNGTVYMWRTIENITTARVLWFGNDVFLNG